MSQAIFSECPREAWRLGVAKILEEREIFSLVTTIGDPTKFNPKWLEAHSPNKRGLNGDELADVIKTIFPYTLHSTCTDRIELYDSYLRRHDRAMRFRRNRGTWGTYFERLIRFPGAQGVNQLETAISKLTSWQTRSTTGLVFHLATPTVDTPRTRGGPCWHYGEIIWRADSTLDLVAVYRNHDFMNKAFGNFLGLGMLLKFLASESGLKTGKLICHSIHAYNGGTSRALRTLAE